MYKSVDFGKYYLIIEEKENVCFKMNKTEYINSDSTKIENIIENILRFRQKNGIVLKNTKSDYMNTLYFFVTDFCNLSCPYCSMRSDNSNIEKNKLSVLDMTDNLFKVVSEMKPRRIIISGGEPFVLSDIIDIIQLLRQHVDSELILQTNGTLISKGDIERLAGNVDSIEISTSHYKDLKHIETIVQLLDQNSIDIVLTFTYQNSEDKKKLWEIVNIAATYDADFLLHFVDYAGSAADKKYPLLNYKERLEVYCEFAKYIIANKYYEKRFASNLFHATKLGHPCSAYGRMAAIYPNKNIYLCHSLVDSCFKIGTLEKYFNVWDSINAIISRDDIKTLFSTNNSKCVNCKYRVICGGLCPAHVIKKIDSDCTLRKIMFYFNAFILNKNVSIKDNLINFVNYCETEEYLEAVYN